MKFEHKVSTFWQLNLKYNNSISNNTSDNYINRNYKLNNNSFQPKLSYFYNKNTFLSLFYLHQNKKNKSGEFENLKLDKFGVVMNFADKDKRLFKAEINFLNNKFTGTNNTPVAYQMLEGLQPGKNYTWSLLVYQKLNSFLNLNINYLGRKSETSKTIHTGTVQLKALF